MGEDPVDVETIRRTAGKVPRFTSVEEAKEYGLLLRGHVQLLLPEAEALLPDPAEASGQRWATGPILRWVHKTLEYDYGDSLASVTWHVDNLAVSCRLLLNLAMSQVDRERLCAWCKTSTQGTRLVRVVETGSGPGGALYACESCRESDGLTQFAEQPPGTEQAPVPAP